MSDTGKLLFSSYIQTCKCDYISASKSGHLKRLSPRAPPLGSSWDGSCHCIGCQGPYLLLPVVKNLDLVFPTGCRMVRLTY